MSLLNKAQAEAVYSAMCALNNVGNCSGEIKLPDTPSDPCGIRVIFNAAGGVYVLRPFAGGTMTERRFFYSQSNFAEAFGLDESKEAA